MLKLDPNPDAHHGRDPIRGYFLTEMAEEVPSDN